MSLSAQRVRDAVLQELERKGYVRAADDADCKVTYSLTGRDAESRKPRVGVGVGGGSGGLGGGIGVSIPVRGRNAHSGEFSLSVIDTKKNAEVWNGSMDAAWREAELSTEEATELARAVLARFPDAPR